MITVLIHIESRFPADRSKIRDFVQNYLSQKLTGEVEVGVSIVGDRKMKQLNSQYREIDETTDVLSFSLDDPKVSSKNAVQSGFSPDKSAPDQVLRRTS